MALVSAETEPVMPYFRTGEYSLLSRDPIMKMNLLSGNPFWLVPFCLFLTSCGRPSGQPELVDVTGTITMEGSPVKGALVQFSPGSGRPSTALTNAEGFYELRYSESEKGALVGRHTVSITLGRPPVTRGGKTVQPAVPEKIPAKYNSSTTLTADVEPAHRQFDFQLTDATPNKK